MTVKLSKNGKRLGRPPKNKDKNPEVFVVESKPYVAPTFDLSSEEMLECSLVPINEYSHIQSDIKRVGRYAQSTYSLNKYGKSSFVVLAYLDTDLEKHRKDGLSDEQIVVRCVNYLNQTEAKKKGQKKDPKKPYGNLQIYGFRTINKFDKEVLAVELVTDSKSNENFWGVGNR